MRTIYILALLSGLIFGAFQLKKAHEAKPAKKHYPYTAYLISNISTTEILCDSLQMFNIKEADVFVSGTKMHVVAEEAIRVRAND
jgi:hypothetical protein